MAINRTSPKKGKVVDIPTAPTIGTATAGSESATVTYTAATVGGPATTFTALSNPGSITGTGTSPITVSGLTAGTAYTFTVRGNNATGNGEYSSASNSVTPTVNTSFESIATSIVGSGGAASITFSSIPQTYKHLQIRAYLKAASTGRGSITVNSGSFAVVHQLFSEGNGPTGSSTASTFNWPLNFSATANIFGANIIDLLDYTSTNKTRVFKNVAGVDYNGSGSIFLMSSLDLSTTATNSITLAPSTGNWSQYTHVALYGIKG
jgi:hypothetical protein